MKILGRYSTTLINSDGPFIPTIKNPVVIYVCSTLLFRSVGSNLSLYRPQLLPLPFIMQHV